MTMIPADTKDWTWVLERPCNECGFDPKSYNRSGFSGAIASNAAQWCKELSKPQVGIRESSNHWSTLEYGCHVRDVYEIFNERLELMLSQIKPTFANWDQDKAAIDGRYGDADSDAVVFDLGVSANKIADRIETLEVSDWEREGLRSNGSLFTVESIIRYLLHDIVHHIWDVAHNGN